MTAEEIQSQIEELESQLTGDMFSDMEIKDKIHNLKMKQNGTRPMNSEIECVGCGSWSNIFPRPPVGTYI